MSRQQRKQATPMSSFGKDPHSSHSSRSMCRSGRHSGEVLIHQSRHDPRESPRVRRPHMRSAVLQPSRFGLRASVACLALCAHLGRVRPRRCVVDETNVARIPNIPIVLRLCWSAHWSFMLFKTHCTKNALLWVPATGSSGLLQEVFQER